MKTKIFNNPEKELFNKNLEKWIPDEKAATELINVSGLLRFDKTIELLITGRQVNDRGAGSILANHLFAENILGIPVSVKNSLKFARTMLSMNLAPASIDLSRLHREWAEEKESYKNDIDSFTRKKLEHLVNVNPKNMEEQDVVLYGFGRIGRMVARELITQSGNGNQLRLRAIVTRDTGPEQLKKRADLFRNDSVHGSFQGVVKTDTEKSLIYINGHAVKMLSSPKPEDIDYEKEGISGALLIDSTGAWRDRENLSRHLKAKGINRVLLTAPGKGDIPNIVFGINHNQKEMQDEKIFSAASCTTNAIVPALYIINSSFNIVKGHVETIHSYTNDQNLLDNYHKNMRRGRSAPLNMVITDTGAAKAAAKAVPELQGKLTANAIRVPTPNVSLAILYLTVEKETTIEEINNIIFEASVRGNFVEQILFSNSTEFVSSDGIGEPYTSIYDSPAANISADGKSMVLYFWYDNEYGYTMQVIRLAKHITNTSRYRYY